MIMEEDYDPEPIGRKLYALVKRLEKKGVSRERLKRSARRLGLSDCSYGSQGWVAPATGLAWGLVGGLAASYACDGLCDFLHVETTKRVVLDVFSLALPALYCFTAGGSERDQKDYQFYRKLQEVYKDRLAEK
jgi:hypothetical protein